MHNGYTYKSCSTFLSRAYSRSIRSSFLYRSSNLCLTTHVSEMPFEESAIINIRMYLNCFKFVLHSASFHLKKLNQVVLVNPFLPDILAFNASACLKKLKVQNVSLMQIYIYRYMYTQSILMLYQEYLILTFYYGIYKTYL